jgi:hypothetical protein
MRNTFRSSGQATASPATCRLNDRSARAASQRRHVQAAWGSPPSCTVPTAMIRGPVILVGSTVTSDG